MIPEMNLNLDDLFCSNHRDNFDDESPFHPNTSSTADRSTTNGCDSAAQPLSIEHFQEETKETFIQMINELTVRIATTICE